jgi:hypothetical protein
MVRDQRTPVPVLAAPGGEHAGAEAVPRPRAVKGVVPTAVRPACVPGTATASTAHQDAAVRAELHRLPCLRAVPCLTLVTLECTPADIAMSVNRVNATVYSPAVLRLRATLG